MTAGYKRRRALHERTAHAIETLHADNLEDHWDALAHHCAHSDHKPKAVIALVGLFLVYFFRGEHTRAQALAEQALQAARRTRTSSDRLTANYIARAEPRSAGRICPCAASAVSRQRVVCPGGASCTRRAIWRRSGRGKSKLRIDDLVQSRLPRAGAPARSRSGVARADAWTRCHARANTVLLVH